MVSMVCTPATHANRVAHFDCALTHTHARTCTAPAYIHCCYCSRICLLTGSRLCGSVNDGHAYEWGPACVWSAGPPCWQRRLPCRCDGRHEHSEPCGRKVSRRRGPLGVPAERRGAWVWCVGPPAVSSKWRGVAPEGTFCCVQCLPNFGGSNCAADPSSSHLSHTPHVCSHWRGRPTGTALSF